MSDEEPRRREIEAIPDVPGDPGEVASAARSCSVILIILAGLVLIACIGVAIALLN